MGQLYPRMAADGSGAVRYTLTRKAVKRLNLRVRRDGSVAVSAPSWVPLAAVDGFVLRHADAIRAAQEAFARLEREVPPAPQYVTGEAFPLLGKRLRLVVESAGRNRAVLEGDCLLVQVKDPEDRAQRQRLVKRFLMDTAAAVFGAVLRELYPTFQPMGLSMPTLRIRDMRSRWGSCAVKRGVITLNLRLLAAPRSCVEYVALHEYCHLLHPNHGKGFYRLLEALMPDWRERRRLLEETAGPWLQAAVR